MQELNSTAFQKLYYITLPLFILFLIVTWCSCTNAKWETEYIGLVQKKSMAKVIGICVGCHE